MPTLANMTQQSAVTKLNKETGQLFTTRTNFLAKLTAGSGAMTVLYQTSLRKTVPVSPVQTQLSAFCSLVFSVKTQDYFSKKQDHHLTGVEVFYTSAINTQINCLKKVNLE